MIMNKRDYYNNLSKEDLLDVVCSFSDIIDEKMKKDEEQLKQDKYIVKSIIEGYIYDFLENMDIHEIKELKPYLDKYNIGWYDCNDFWVDFTVFERKGDK